MEQRIFHKQKELIGNYSLTSEKQGNNNGNNTFVSEGILNVVVRKEPIETRAWDAKLGFVNHHFDYMGMFCMVLMLFRSSMAFSALKCVSKEEEYRTLSG